MTPADVARFWSKVDRSGGPEACWPYTGSRFQDGRGSFSIAGKKKIAYRIAFTLANGREPVGHVRHTCDNPPCCNPADLIEGTNDDNVADRVQRSRSATGDRNGARRHPERLARGERQGLARLTEEAVREIRDLAGAGWSRRRLAARFGVRKYTVDLVVTRKTWAHVP